MSDTTGKSRRDLQRQEMGERKRAYEFVFVNPNNANKLVLADLRRFCRERTSCWSPDPRLHALLEGRREVVLRIADFLELSVEELCDKYGGSDQNAASTAS